MTTRVLVRDWQRQKDGQRVGCCNLWWLDGRRQTPAEISSRLSQLDDGLFMGGTNVEPNCISGGTSSDP